MAEKKTKKEKKVGIERDNISYGEFSGPEFFLPMPGLPSDKRSFYLAKGEKR
jgi:hypothetical protein